MIAACCFAFPAMAGLPDTEIEFGGDEQPSTKLTVAQPFSKNEPVLIEAENVDYDQTTGIVVASGHVQVVQGATVLLADMLGYDQKHNLVTAHGNVSMLEPSGHVYFAEELELRDDLKAGVIEHFKARMVDDSLFAAAHAEKVNEHIIELSKAVYSPCKVECDADGESHDPLWQIRADHVVVDQEKQTVVYDDAFFEVYGLPIIYTPYLSHATPNADNKSGFLMPEYAHNDNLGSIYKVPFYYAMAPDKDITLVPIHTTREGLVMAGEYRQQFDSGGMIWDGSITSPQDRDPAGNITSGSTLRGHLNGKGNFTLNEYADGGFDIHRTTDDTYLRRYNISQDTLLTSKVYLQGYNFIDGGDRTYGSIKGLAFQGLTADTDSDRVPFVLPLADFTYQGDPGLYHSRFTFDGNLMALSRDTGAKSRRVSMIPGWKLPYLTDDGQIIEFSTQLRTDIYSVQDVLLSDGRLYDGVTGRVVPQAALMWRYPFASQFEHTHLLIEPIANFVVSPGGGNPETIPNEDSVVPEFTDTNLFDENRFAGLDRIENGPRVSYGFRGQAQFFANNYVDWLIGQHYRIDEDRAFPFSNELGSQFSDYVGKVGFASSPFTFAYRFRLDKDTLNARRNEIDSSVNMYPATLSMSYLSLENDPILATKEEAVGNLGVNLTKEWVWNIGARRDIKLDLFTSVNSGLVFQDECTTISGIVGKEFTRDRDVEPATTFLFRITLKNLN